MKKTDRLQILPPGLPPFGVDRFQAAALIGIGETLFDQCVESGTLPQPRVIGGRNVFDVGELYEAFKRMPHRAARHGNTGTNHGLDDGVSAVNPWDDA